MDDLVESYEILHTTRTRGTAHANSYIYITCILSEIYQIKYPENSSTNV